MTYERETGSRRKGNAALVLAVLLYGQGLLGLAAVTAVLLKDRPQAARPAVVASIAAAQPSS